MEASPCFTLQYHRAGLLQYQFATQRMRQTQGPHAWVTFPGKHYLFGAPEGLSRHHQSLSFFGPKLNEYLTCGLISASAGKAPVQIARPEQFNAIIDDLFSSLGDFLGDQQYRDTRGSDQCQMMRPNQPRAIHLLEGLLLEMRERPAERLANPWTTSVSTLAKAIQRDPLQNWNFEEEIKRMHMNMANFRRIFPKCTGAPPERYLRECRLDYAARLLCETDLPIAEIARQVRIPDIHHFSKLFKAMKKLPPGRYRNTAYLHHAEEGDQ